MLALPTQRQLARLQQRSDVVCYTSAVLAVDAELIGAVTATLAIRSNREHTDCYVCLCDIDRRGRATQITDGYRRLRPGRFEVDGSGIRRFSIDCWPTAYRVRRGHRLSLIVGSGAHPRYARNPGTGESLATATVMVTAQQEVLHVSVHGSEIALPVLSELQFQV
jgi:putative CocE/NonD family hydrolase